jgi:restriction system protein
MADPNIHDLIVSAVAVLWWAIPLAILWLIVDSSWFKGKFGEYLVARSFKKHLDPEIYTVLHDVTLPVRDGTTQIDHIVVSPFGVFVIETKNMSGWIFGSSKNKRWTQTFRRKKFSFQNPLRQNFKHLKAVSETTGLPESKLRSVVIFTGAAEFRTAMPANVTTRAGGVFYIRTLRARILSDPEIGDALSALRGERLKRGVVTNRSHVRQLKTKRKQPVCSRCGSAMVKRTTRKGPRAGSEFWGCSTFPKCKATRPLDG